MSNAGIERYIPWADDAFLPGESPYALLNKLAWFACRGPVQLMRDLRATDGTPHPTAPSVIDFSWSGDVWHPKADTRMWPVKKGKLGRYFDRTFYNVLSESSYVTRESVWLRFCPECIAAGMHFTITQSLLVENCPHHHRRLNSCCPECGEKIRYDSDAHSEAFGCRACGHLLLAPELTDIRANRRYRWRVSRSHQDLVRTLKAAPTIHCPVKGRLNNPGLRHGLKEAMTPLIYPDRPVSARSPAAPHYAIVKVGRNIQGLPCIQPVSLPAPSKPPLPPLPTDYVAAQKRAGAWALQAYRDHRACICAARASLKYEKRCQFSLSEGPSICCIGKGFAVWEAGGVHRANQRLFSGLREAWGLTSAREMDFAAYVLEKVSLSGTIMAFFKCEYLSCTNWERQDLISDFSSWESTSHQDQRQAILWQDIRHLDLSGACDLTEHSETARWKWLELVCADLLGQPKNELMGQMQARIEMDDLTGNYAAHQRAALTMPALHRRLSDCGAAAC